MAERHRRKKNNDRLYMLRSVVPKISKHWEHLCECTPNKLRLFYRYTLAELNDMLYTVEKPDSKEAASVLQRKSSDENAVALAKKVKKALLDKYQKRTEISLSTALVSATIATVMCYPLDTVRRQMQTNGSPFQTIFYAFPGNIYDAALS